MIQRNDPKIPSFTMDQPTFSQPDPEIQDLQKRLGELEREVNGRMSFETDILGLFETVSTAPTNTPYSPYDQVKIYVNGGTYRLYWYDGNANVWHYVTATA